MDKNSPFGELMEKGQQTASDTTQKAASDVVMSVAGQLGLKNESASNNAQNTQQTQNQASVPAEPSSQPQDGQALEDSELTKEMVEEFYAPSAEFPQNMSISEQEDADTKLKLVALRKQLHDEFYYNPLVNPKNQEEERPAERVERQEKEEMQDLQQKEADKPAPIAVQRAQTSTEMNRGVAG